MPLEHLLCIGKGWLCQRYRGAGIEPLAGPKQQLEEAACLRHLVRQSLRIQMLDEALVLQAYDRRVYPEARRRRGRPLLEPSVPVESPAELAIDVVHHDIDIDAACGMVDEPDQHCDAQEAQGDTESDRQMRHKATILIAADCAQGHQRIGEGGKKDAESELIASVFGEVAQEPWAHLARG
jgi:hypothetical protein